MTRFKGSVPFASLKLPVPSAPQPVGGTRSVRPADAAFKPGIHAVSGSGSARLAAIGLQPKLGQANGNRNTNLPPEVAPAIHTVGGSGSARPAAIGLQPKLGQSNGSRNDSLPLLQP
jgi:hypothetical protein